MSTYVTDFVEIRNFNTSITMNPDSLSLSNLLTYNNMYLAQMNFQSLSGKVYKHKIKGVFDSNKVRLMINGAIRILELPDADPLFTLDARINLKGTAGSVDYYYIYDPEGLGTDEDNGSETVYSYLRTNQELKDAFETLGFIVPSATPTNSVIRSIEWKLRTKISLEDFGCYAFKDRVTTASLSNHFTDINIYDTFPQIHSWFERLYGV